MVTRNVFPGAVLEHGGAFRSLGMAALRITLRFVAPIAGMINVHDGGSETA